MKKKISIYIAVAVMTILLVGCNRGISNDVITIRNYKGLVVEDNDDVDSVWQALLDNCEVKEYPQEELETLTEELKTQYGYIAGKTAEEVIQEIHGVTSQELAKEQLKKEYAITLIAEKEELTLSETEYQKELEKRAEANGIPDVHEYEDMYGKEELRAMMLEERVLEFLVDNMQ